MPDIPRSRPPPSPDPAVNPRRPSEQGSTMPSVSTVGLGHPSAFAIIPRGGRPRLPSPLNPAWRPPPRATAQRAHQVQEGGPYPSHTSSAPPMFYPHLELYPRSTQDEREMEGDPQAGPSQLPDVFPPLPPSPSPPRSEATEEDPLEAHFHRDTERENPGRESATPPRVTVHPPSPESPRTPPFEFDPGNSGPKVVHGSPPIQLAESSASGRARAHLSHRTLWEDEGVERTDQRKQGKGKGRAQSEASSAESRGAVTRSLPEVTEEHPPTSPAGSPPSPDPGSDPATSISTQKRKSPLVRSPTFPERGGKRGLSDIAAFAGQQMGRSDRPKRTAEWAAFGGAARMRQQSIGPPTNRPSRSMSAPTSLSSPSSSPSTPSSSSSSSASTYPSFAIPDSPEASTSTSGRRLGAGTGSQDEAGGFESEDSDTETIKPPDSPGPAHRLLPSAPIMERETTAYTPRPRATSVPIQQVQKGGSDGEGEEDEYDPDIILDYLRAQNEQLRDENEGLFRAENGRLNGRLNTGSTRTMEERDALAEAFGNAHLVSIPIGSPDPYEFYNPDQPNPLLLYHNNILMEIFARILQVLMRPYPPTDTGATFTASDMPALTPPDHLWFFIHTADTELLRALRMSMKSMLRGCFNSAREGVLGVMLRRLEEAQLKKRKGSGWIFWAKQQKTLFVQRGYQCLPPESPEKRRANAPVASSSTSRTGAQVAALPGSDMQLFWLKGDLRRVSWTEMRHYVNVRAEERAQAGAEAGAEPDSRNDEATTEGRRLSSD